MGILTNMNSTGWMILVVLFGLVATMNIVAYYAEYWTCYVDGGFGDDGNASIFRFYLFKGVCYQATAYTYDCLTWNKLLDQHELVEDYYDDAMWGDSAGDIESNWEPSGPLVVTALAISLLCIVLCVVAINVESAKFGLQIVVATLSFVAAVLMIAVTGLTARSDLTKKGNDILLPGFEIDESIPTYGFSVLVVGWFMSLAACLFAIFPCCVDDTVRTAVSKDEDGAGL